MAQRPSLENVKKRICREVRTNHSVNNRVERSSRDVSVTEREARYGSTDNIRVVAGVYVFCMQCVVYMRSFPGTCHITCKTRNAFKTLLATVLKSAYFYMCILTLNFSYKIKFPIYLQIPLFTAEFHHPFIVNIPNRLNFIFTDQDIPGFSSWLRPDNAPHVHKLSVAKLQCNTHKETLREIHLKALGTNKKRLNIPSLL